MDSNVLFLPPREPAKTNPYAAIINRTADTPEHRPSRQDLERTALTLAEQQGYLEMCRPVLWTGEDEEQFGTLLRAVVLEFLPESRVQLELLKNIISVQWHLYRVHRIQNITLSKADGGRGNYPYQGINRSAAAGFTIGLSIQEGLLRQLDKAITTYRKVKR